MMEPTGFGRLVMTLAGLLLPILLILLVVLILHLGQRSAEREREHRERRRPAGGPEPGELERRLAEGEIDREEYGRLRAEPPER